MITVVGLAGVLSVTVTEIFEGHNSALDLTLAILVVLVSCLPFLLYFTFTHTRFGSLTYGPVFIAIWVWFLVSGERDPSSFAGFKVLWAILLSNGVVLVSLGVEGVAYMTSQIREKDQASVPSQHGQSHTR
jgi:hypothetical protein